MTVGATPAFAQAGAATATAQHLFDEGLAAMKRNDFVAACEAFSGSNEADPSPGTQINLALCNEKQNKLASAWGWYNSAASLATQKGQSARAELAKGEAAKLEPKLHKMVINVKFPVDGLVVTRDGVKVPQATLGKEDPVDPGDHVIEVSAPKKITYKQKVTVLATPGVDRFDMPALQDAPVEKVVPPPGGDQPVVVVGNDGSTQRTLGIIATITGILCGVPVGIFAALTASENKKGDDYDRQAAASQAKGDAAGAAENTRVANTRRDAARSNQTGAIAFGVVGGVLLIGGVIMILTAPSGKPVQKAESKELTFAPVIGSGTYGFGLGGTF